MMIPMLVAVIVGPTLGVVVVAVIVRKVCVGFSEIKLNSDQPVTFRR